MNTLSVVFGVLKNMLIMIYEVPLNLFDVVFKTCCLARLMTVLGVLAFKGTWWYCGITYSLVFICCYCVNQSTAERKGRQGARNHVHNINERTQNENRF